MANIKPKNKLPKDENGKAHGEWLFYHDNGRLMYRANYVHEIRHGLDESYYSSGILMYRGYRNMGRRVGYWYLYSQKRHYLCLI